jgi:hypothetical protein
MSIYRDSKGHSETAEGAGKIADCGLRIIQINPQAEVRSPRPRNSLGVPVVLVNLLLPGKTRILAGKALR